jgi:hypothetical protein
VAERSSTNDRFVARQIPELTHARLSFLPSWVSDDTCVMYLDLSDESGKNPVPYRVTKPPMSFD